MFCIYFIYVLLSPVAPGQVTLRFSSVSKLLKLEREENILDALTTSTCLLTIAKTNVISDMDLLIDFMDMVKIKTKHLVILTSRMLQEGFKQLLNKAINFEVRFQMEDTGNRTALKLFDSARQLFSTYKVPLSHLCVQQLEKMLPNFKSVNAQWMIKDSKGKTLTSPMLDFHPSLSTLSLLGDQMFKQ